MSSPTPKQLADWRVRQAMATTARLLLVERVMPSDLEPSFELATYDINSLIYRKEQLLEKATTATASSR